MTCEECLRGDEFPTYGGATTASSVCSTCTLILSEFWLVALVDKSEVNIVDSLNTTFLL
jgi:hypothetical protein